MNKKILSIFLSMLFLLCIVGNLEAGSIWAKRDKNMRELYTDDVARQIGDILTIIITEDSKVDNKSQRDLKKKTDRSATFNGQLGIDHLLPSIPGISMTAESSNELKGKADYKDERSFVDRITVIVVDIHPNGNMVVMGTRNRKIAGDTQIIEVSGIVRPSDVAFDNAVKSEKVAEFRIITKNKGIAEPFNRPGFLGRIMDVLWPF